MLPFKNGRKIRKSPIRPAATLYNSSNCLPYPSLSQPLYYISLLKISINSMEQHFAVLSFARDAILSLNKGLVTFEQARALFGIELSSFKNVLVVLDIFVWNEVNRGPVRIHGGDYSITIVIKERQKSYVVQATKPFESVISMIEADLSLSRGCYRLTYILPPGVNILVKTDRDWHFAVEFSKERGNFVHFDLEICPSSTTADVDASDDEDASEI